MTRDEFFSDLNKLVRLLVQLGIPEDLEAEAAERIAAMKAGGAGVTPDDLRRYSEAIDWAAQKDVRLLGDLVKVLLRIVAGLASELESFRRASG